MPAKWFYSRNGHDWGPLGLTELRDLARTGEIGPDDMIRQEGSTLWEPLRKVFPKFVQVEEPDEPLEIRERPHMPSWLKTAACVWTGFCIIAWLGVTAYILFGLSSASFASEPTGDKVFISAIFAMEVGKYTLAVWAMVIAPAIVLWNIASK